MKKFIAILMIFTNFLVPVSAKSIIAEEIPVQEPYSYDPIVHEEILSSDTIINEDYLDSENLNFSALCPDEDGVMTAAADLTALNIWESIYSSTYGEDYLSPLMRAKDEIYTSERTNKLIIKNTDLTLKGKNGMDVVIKREYDSQYDNNIYVGLSPNQYPHLLQNYVYIYDMLNTSTNEIVKVGVYSEDFYYIYLDEGLQLRTIDNISLKTHTAADGTVTRYYAYEDLNYYRTDAENATVTFTPVSADYKRVVETGPSDNFYADSIKILGDKGNLGCGFRLLLPEVFMQQISSEADRVGYPKIYDYYYSGSFRGMDGSVFSLSGSSTLYKYQDDTKSFRSTFTGESNKFLKYEFFYEEQTVPETDRKYRFAVYDKRGYNYYFAGQDPLSPRQIMHPVAITDNYGNSILYDYNEDGKIIKITDTFEREIEFSYTENSMVISYAEGGEDKTISYSNETLPATAMENDSLLNGKAVQKFSYTNENGETTSYYLRAATLPVLFDGFRSYDINISPFYMRDSSEPTQMKLQSTYNLERIVYPTGKTSEYRYTPYFMQCKDLDVLRGYYCLEKSYDIENNLKINEKTYTLSGKREIYVVEQNDEGFKKTREFDAYGKISREMSSVATTYYTHYGNAPSRIENNRYGIWNTQNYEYYANYGYLVKSESDSKKKIEYTYHTVDNNMTDMVKTAVIYKYVNTGWFIDYTITTALTSDNKKIAYEEITKDGVVVSRKDYTYNEWGDISSVTTKLNENETLTVNSAYTVTDNKELIITNSMDGTTDADGTASGEISKSQSFDIYGNIISSADPLGNLTSIEYDDSGRVKKHTYPNGGYINIEYNLSKNYVIYTEISGAKLKYSYNKAGYLLKLERIYQDTTDTLEEYSYDEYYRIAQKKSYISENAGQKTEYTYDSAGRVLTEKISKIENNEWCYTNSYSYTKDNTNKWYVVSVSTVAADGSVQPTEKLSYDYYDNLMKREIINGNTTLSESYTYDYENRLTAYTDFNGNTESYTYDFNGNLVLTTRADGAVSSNIYDMGGRKISETDYMGNTTVYTYDKLSRLIKTTSPLDERYSQTKYYYDNAGNQIKKTSLMDISSELTEEYTYDCMNNLTGMISGQGAEKSAVKYAYDLSGNIISQTTGLSSLTAEGGKTTAYEYNPFGELIKETDPMGYVKTYSYNLSGNPVTVTDKNGNNTSYTYDMFGLTSETAGNIINTVIKDSLGREKIKAFGNISDTISYDVFGRVSKIQSGDTEKSYTYDNNSNVTGFVLKKNNEAKQTVSYSYNNLNQVTQITDNGITTSYVYNLNGNPVSETRNGLTTAYEYNQGGLVTKITGVNTYEAEYFQNGMKSSETASGITKGYTYDSLGRLKTVSGNAPESYSYDLRGNILSKTTSDGIYSYTYDDNNRQITEIKKADGETESETTRFYDYNGNLVAERTLGNALVMDFSISQTNPGGVKFYGYDGFNRLISYSDENGEISYTYGTDNLRRSKRVNNLTTNYVWDGQNMVYEYTEDSENIYGYDVMGVSSANMNGTQYFYEKDTHGNISAVLNSNGIAVQNNEYTPFGEKADANSNITPFGYSGEYQDLYSGLIYLRNRYYDPSIGRFITEDPARDGLNWYVYANNNPIKHIDPSGLYYLEKDKDGQVYAVIETGDTLSNISYSEVADANAYLDLNYAEPGFLEVGQRVNITGIYNENYPVPTNITLSKTGHTQGDSGLRDVPDEEISRRARDRNLSGEERRRYQREEKLRGQRNKQKRQSHYSVQSQLPYPNTSFSPVPNQTAPKVNMPDSQFWGKVGTGVITVVGVAAGIYYFCYTGDPSMIYQYAR